jgi:nucleoid-associated protein YgaU
MLYPEGAMATEPRNITPAGKTYTVVKGDSLSKIARREYGDVREWKKIYEANKDVIDNPDLIEPGQDLIIPER